MKRIKRCLVCGKSVPLSLAYQAEVEQERKSPITGEVTYVLVKGVICPACNQDMGYKGSKAKLEKWEGVVKR